jgi:hypothetical protein
MTGRLWIGVKTNTRSKKAGIDDQNYSLAAVRSLAFARRKNCGARPG